MKVADKIKVFIVDDHQLVIDGITSLLLHEPEFEITGTSNHPADVPAMLGRIKADIVLTDVQMPEITGVELARMLQRQYPGVYILALSMHSDIGIIRQMLDSGISGYILKNTGKKELIEALKKVAKGENYFSPEITRGLMKAVKNIDQPVAHLTNREVEIIRLIEQELSNKQIADTLCISERTVETHRKNIFRKTNTQSIIGLIKFAYENKII
jgi:two-component system, NarL family, nitrate/nitrite response regulator NarL